ncbi:DUF2680 domain-containing protein [Salirhabdus sp. Marseille-P4669]|uniref:DUF2680 domain-containing protein n=1 Tax=Salirhabdus sp. Marseille-P4669 TaxID=2042310 RepID=UPI00135B48ED|nr:DUF2680 domain-containing protein [Salirhabdus sp. Marseille-P4669]
MKRLLLVTLTVSFSLAFMTAGHLFAEDEGQVHKPNQDVELNDDQMKEMEDLHNELFEVHKKILNKYGEYGVLTDEQVENKIEHMEKYQEKLKENGYIPDWHHKKDKMREEE